LYLRFPLKEHLIDVQPAVQAPNYLLQQPFLKLDSVFTPSSPSEYENVNVLKDWPEDPKTELDKSQLRALKRILTKRLAIVQGPPGTGKTHVSVMALKVMLDNMKPGDPPIIVACQTNHALDQLLRHVALFEEKFARLGGRSKDTDIIKKRTLYFLRQGKKTFVTGGMRGPARTKLDALSSEMCVGLSALELGKGLQDHVLLRKMGIITETQCESLEKDTNYCSNSTTEELPLKTWIGKQLVENKRSFQQDDLGYDFEEIDLEFEQLKELEAENCAQDDDEDFESLRGPGLSLWDSYVGKSTSNVTDDHIQELLTKYPNLYDIKPRFRGAVYNYFRSRVKEALLKWLRQKAEAYSKNVVDFKAGGWEQDQVLLRKQGIKIIGMTTTGLSKYRALVAGLSPKIVLIEEAAETMEAPVISACVPTLEHLILVGDHKQLRPQCAVRDLERYPFNMNVSLFERMVNMDNKVEFSMLKKQRRMIPEIRRLLKPIYNNSIIDHELMKDDTVRPGVPGMGGINSFFFTHYWPETADEHLSSTNQMEADMIVGFFVHLVHNGMTEKQITVLTFYNGQRKLLLRKLRQHHNLVDRVFKVTTVDSYQGEENDVVILSLVRSNPDGNIGFLGVENRICVALSRAKRGFYLFGNGELLAGESKVWAKVVTIMAGRGKHCEPPPSKPNCRVVFNVPTTCTNHGRSSFVSGPDSWDFLYGGCQNKCTAILSCGHTCPINCHPFDHERILCAKACNRTLPCGHCCSSICGDPCKCATCKSALNKEKYISNPQDLDTKGNSQTSSIEAWKAYAIGDVKRHDLGLHRKKLELDLAADVGRQRDELRDKFLQDQVTRTSFPPRPSILPQAVTQPAGPASIRQNSSLVGQTANAPHLFNDDLSLNDGAHFYPRYENTTTAKRINSERVMDDPKVRPGFGIDGSELLVDLS
jgi:helicase required for RNAi-mediated heterochromatin assembly 1